MTDYGTEYVIVTACPLCGGTASQSFDRRTFRAFPVENRLCSGCGLVYQSPRMSDQALDEFYIAEYRQAYQGEAGPTSKDLYVQGHRAASLVDFLKKAMPGPIDPPFCLDIGSSSGLLLEQLKQDFSLGGMGVEPGEAYRAFSIKRGLEVVTSLNELSSRQLGPFGLVSMIHVLEHLPNPIEVLLEVRQNFLARTGLLLVEVPNLYAHDCFEVAHLTSFSSHTLTRLLGKAGFTITHLRAHGAPRSRLLQLYLTALAIPTSQMDPMDNIKPEGSVRLKRSLGLLRRYFLERFTPGKAWLPLPKG